MGLADAVHGDTERPTTGRGVLLEGLTKSFGGANAVDDVTLTIEPGQIAVLLGSSGAGKSTILSMLTGLLKPDSGRVVVDGVDITDQTPEQRGVGVVFQSFALFPHMTVAANVGFGLRRRKVRKEEERRLVTEYLERVGLVDKAARYPSQLSGGERQRVAFARAMIINPRVLALDEPFGSLDVHLRDRLRDMVHDLVKEYEVPTLLITHDADDAFKLADSVAVIKAGRIEQEGSLAHLYAHPATAFVARFLGELNTMPSRVDGEDVLLRPDRIIVTDPADARVVGRVTDVRQSRNALAVRLDVGDRQVTVAVPPQTRPQVGSDIGLAWDPSEEIRVVKERVDP